MAADYELTPAKAVLLAVALATSSDIRSLQVLAAQESSLVPTELMLRIILTYLPESLDPSLYVPLLKVIDEPKDKLHTTLHDVAQWAAATAILSLPEERAMQRTRKVQLLGLEALATSEKYSTRLMTSFLIHRAYRMDEEAGLLHTVPALLEPFFDRNPEIRAWCFSTVLPLVRRQFEYYPASGSTLSLREFATIPTEAAFNHLLSESEDPSNVGNVGRDIAGILTPWLFNEVHCSDAGSAVAAPAWKLFIDWITGTSKRCPHEVAAGAFEQWDGPTAVDSRLVAAVDLAEADVSALQHSYLRAAMGLAYALPEATTTGLASSFRILQRVQQLRGLGRAVSLDVEAAKLTLKPDTAALQVIGAQSISAVRQNLLHDDNVLTSPTTAAISLLQCLLVSAYLFTELGLPCTARMAAEVLFNKDGYEQKAEFAKLVRAIDQNAPGGDDDYWLKARRRVLWLHDWGLSNAGGGLFTALPHSLMELELLRTLLRNTRYTLARSIYEGGQAKPLAAGTLKDTVLECVSATYDNASSWDRTRGGLKKCHDLLDVFSATVPRTDDSARKFEALLTVAHGLSSYQLCAKSGERLRPVVLRVHSDPILLIQDVLEQNPTSYTHMNEFVGLSRHMVAAGLFRGKVNDQMAVTEHDDQVTLMAETRIVAMCIEAALHEDDYETAYSYVMARLSNQKHNDGKLSTPPDDIWSWEAALKVGMYTRVQQSHISAHWGTSSGNPELRHLEQRLECLATALRIAPAARLTEILKKFRRCEEQVDSAIAEEAAKEEAWDIVGDVQKAPGAFHALPVDLQHSNRQMRASSAAHQPEETPMSLFDLSRATARLASQKLMTSSAMSNKDSISVHVHNQKTGEHVQTSSTAHMRKRDQIRDAATGTLVSGVGWLIGAKVPQ